VKTKPFPWVSEVPEDGREPLPARIVLGLALADVFIYLAF
jgi:hypothetical protein